MTLKECPICYNDSLSLVVLNCGHEFCCECLRSHCQHELSIQRVPIACPGSHNHTDNECTSTVTGRCRNKLSVETVRSVLLEQEEQGEEEKQQEEKEQEEEEQQDTNWTNRYGSLDGQKHPEQSQSQQDWIKFQRLLRLSQDKSLIPCTRCQEPTSKSSVSTVATCPACGHVFCVIHGDAHPNQSCRDYQRQQQNIQRNQQDSHSADTTAGSETDATPEDDTHHCLPQDCKPCSHCQVPISKEAGTCDHIVCPCCHNDMCYKCGTHKHLKGDDFIRNCKRCHQSFIDHRYLWKYRLLIAVALPLYLPFYLLHVILVGAVALATCGCGCCLGCGIQKTKKNTQRTKPGRSKREGDEAEESQGSFTYTYRPLLATRTVLSMVLLPFIDLFHQCGIPCCCNLELSMHKNSRGEEDGDDDDDYEGGDDKDFYEQNRDDNDDIERQLQLKATTSTLDSSFDIEGDSKEEGIYDS